MGFIIGRNLVQHIRTVQSNTSYQQNEVKKKTQSSHWHKKHLTKVNTFYDKDTTGTERSKGHIIKAI